MKKIILVIIVFLLVIGNMYAQQLGTPTSMQQIINAIPAVPIPLVGKNLKFEFGGDNWIAKMDGQNIFAGLIEENESILTLKTTHVWTGAVEIVIDLLQKVGIPLGPAAAPLRTAARLAARVAGWIPFGGSSIILNYNAGTPIPLSFVGMERQESDRQTRERTPRERTTRESTAREHTPRERTTRENNTQVQDTRIRYDVDQKLRHPFHPPSCCHNVIGRR
jgi:hypothetical protein